MKNRLDTENINVIFCPTEEILAEFYTKPLQGNLCRIFRDVVMGLKHISTLKIPPISADQERVGNNVSLESDKSRNILEDELTNSGVDSKTVKNVKEGITDASTEDTRNVQEEISTKVHNHDISGDNPVHRKSYAYIVKEGTV